MKPTKKNIKSFYHPRKGSKVQRGDWVRWVPFTDRTSSVVWIPFLTWERVEGDRSGRGSLVGWHVVDYGRVDWSVDWEIARQRRGKR